MSDKAGTLPGPWGHILDYIEVLKPRETSLLIFIGLSATVVAAGGQPPRSVMLMALIAIALGSAGCNGLTNYLDRHIDARMLRTRDRALPSGRIQPAENVLPLIIGLLAIALGLAWLLHPYALCAGLVGILAATIARKTSLSHLLLGGVAGSAPVAVGYFAAAPRLDLTLALLAAIIMLWTPVHIWSLMAAYREDYLRAGLRLFVVTWGVRRVVWLLFLLSLLLYFASLALFFVADLGWLYFAVANVLGVAVAFSTSRILSGEISRNAWRVFKLSAYPYLGLLFLAMWLDLIV